MRALLSTASGGPETLVIGELPEPVAGPGQVANTPLGLWLT